MSRSHKARYRRYPNHHIWWLKNVRFASRPPSPRERALPIDGQLEEYLVDSELEKLIDHQLRCERIGNVEVRLSWETSCETDESDWCEQYLDDLLEYEHDGYDGCGDVIGIDDDVSRTDPRWVGEYLCGADTGLDEPNDQCDLDDDLDDLWLLEIDLWDYTWHTWPPSSTVDLADHRQRERSKAGDRHYRSHR